jgi:hypothetical protein
VTSTKTSWDGAVVVNKIKGIWSAYSPKRITKGATTTKASQPVTPSSTRTTGRETTPGKNEYCKRKVDRRTNGVDKN